MRLPDWTDIRADVFIRVRILLLELPRDRAHFGARLFERHSRLQAAHHVNESWIANLEVFTRQRLRLHHHRHKIFGGDADDRAVESARSYADHCEWVLVDLDGFADHFWIGAKSPAPQAVAQDYVRIRVGSVCVVGVKRPAARRFHPEQIEIVLGDDQAPVALRLLFLFEFQIRADELEADHPGKNMVVIAVVFVIGIRACVVGTVGHHGFNVDELLGILDERERMKKDGFEPAVNCRVAADAEREREHCDSCESRILREHPDSVTNVLQQCFHFAPCVPAAAISNLRRFQTHPCTSAE